MSNLEIQQANKLEDSARLAERLLELLSEVGIDAENTTEALLGIMTSLSDIPKLSFSGPPEYVREDDFHNSPSITAEPLRSNHGFFDVINARASRRDFAPRPLSIPTLMSLLYWTVGVREEMIAYGYREAPLRYVPSAGGLASIDCYVVAARVNKLDPGSYYYHYRRGLLQICKGHMIHKIAEMTRQEWVTEAAAVLVFVGNCNRVVKKYGDMAAKLIMLDAGVAVGHCELVANALELRATQLGGLPSREIARLLDLDGTTRVPLTALAVGGRPHEY